MSDRHSQHYAISTHSHLLIGHIELDHIAWRSGDAELRIRIGEKAYWDQGFGTDAVRTLVRHAFSALGLTRVYLRVFAANRRAIRCYEKVGFRKEGRLRRPGPDGGEVTLFLMRILRSEFFQGPRAPARAASRKPSEKPVEFKVLIRFQGEKIPLQPTGTDISMSNLDRDAKGRCRCVSVLFPPFLSRF